ncbi:efflux RND transporter periplasmic adaptor subunit [Neptunitalea lumnitzerae]|uniref:Hemolysin D n=1 Tax=Neptunitalea lumnitzerae TaxID=2965509 RepID=A0ABQ5MJC6_9FLAO|nr:efflux RND transporter periplasmic adaptor subunit [Neptunitalea sp. Y10]GLB49508.1 hemolysin D [Neptunitalea sp. Y10]
MKNLLYIISFLLLISCSENKQETEIIASPVGEASNLIFVSNEQFDTNHMKIEKPTPYTFETYISANGVIDVPPQNRASIRTFMAGYVKKSPYLIGDKVTKGTLLLTLKNPEFVTIQQEYMETAQRLEFLESEYKRQEKLYDENISSEKKYLKAKSDYYAATATYKGLEKKISMMNLSPKNILKGNFSSTIAIYAPISGTIGNISFSIGSYISPTDELMEIINNDHLHLELSVFEKDILKVKKEQKIKFSVLEASEEVYTGSVHLVGNTISENKTTTVHAHIDNEEKVNFSVGMYVNSKIITGSKKQNAIQITALKQDNENAFIYVLEKQDNQGYYFTKIPMKEYLINEEMISVSDIYSNNAILVSGISYL